MNDPQNQVKGKKEKNMFEEWGEQINEANKKTKREMKKIKKNLGEQMNEANKKAKKDLKKFKKNLGEAVDDHKDIIVGSAVGVAVVAVGVILTVALLGYYGVIEF